MKTRVNTGPLAHLLQQKNYFSWLIYGLSTLLVLLLQAAPRLFPVVFDARPMPLTIFVICVGVLGGARAGASVGVLAGVLWGVFSFRLFGFDALILLILGLTAGLLVEWFLRANFFTALLLCACGTAIHVLLEWLLCNVIFQKDNLLEMLFKVLLPNGLYTVLLTPLVFWFSYVIARLVRRKANTI